jgi:hypothetical protein
MRCTMRVVMHASGLTAPLSRMTGYTHPPRAAPATSRARAARRNLCPAQSPGWHGSRAGHRRPSARSTGHLCVRRETDRPHSLSQSKAEAAAHTGHPAVRSYRRSQGPPVAHVQAPCAQGLPFAVCLPPAASSSSPAALISSHNHRRRRRRRELFLPDASSAPLRHSLRRTPCLRDASCLPRATAHDPPSHAARQRQQHSTAAARQTHPQRRRHSHRRTHSCQSPRDDGCTPSSWSESWSGGVESDTTLRTSILSEGHRASHETVQEHGTLMSGAANTT